MSQLIHEFSETEQRLFSSTKLAQTKQILFSGTKLSETKIETFSETKFSKIETETLQKFAKVSRPRPRLLDILDNFWRDLLQIIPSFSFSVFLLFQKKRCSPSPNIFLLFLLRFSCPQERECQRSSLCFPPSNRYKKNRIQI